MISRIELIIMVDKKTYYSFTYCTMHDSAFIVRGSHTYGLPANFKNNNLDCASISKGCQHCDWTNKGILSVEDTKCNIIKQIETDYDKQYGGGFTFNMINSIFDENGDELELENDSPFMISLKKIKTLTKN